MNNIDKAIWEFSSVLDRDGIHIYVKNPLLMNLRKFYKIDRAIIELLNTEKTTLIIAQLVEGTNVLRINVPTPVRALREKCVEMVLDELLCISSSGLDFRSDDRWLLYSTNPELRKCIAYVMG